MLRVEEKHLHNNKEYVDVFRAQGSTGVLNEILNLEADLLEYQKNVIDGKIQPIKEE